MMIQKSKDKPLQFDANLEQIIIRTFEKRLKNRSCESAVLYQYFLVGCFIKFQMKKSHVYCSAPQCSASLDTNFKKV
jgi:hypothetical protein